jgi:hypothetical protein
MKFALLNYSRTYNIGDEIQSLAAKQFLPQVDCVVERDRLSEFEPSEQTRVILNGWFMHNPEHFGVHGSVDPLIVSFHASPSPGLDGLSEGFSGLLSLPGMSNALAQFAPIGARDLYTLELLQGLGIETYFSGCLTLTLNPRQVSRGDAIVLSDLAPAAASWVHAATDRDILLIKHSPKIAVSSERSFERAEKVLDAYAAASLVVTSRLHVALPCLALETPVILVGDHLGDPRFRGLSDLCRHYTVSDFMRLDPRHLDEPEPNPSRYLSLRVELSERVRDFVANGSGRELGSRVAPHATAWALARYFDGKAQSLSHEVASLRGEVASLREQLESAANQEQELIKENAVLRQRISLQFDAKGRDLRFDRRVRRLLGEQMRRLTTPGSWLRAPWLGL